MDVGFFVLIFSVALILFFVASTLDKGFFALVSGALFLIFGISVMSTGVCFQDIANTTVSLNGYWEYANDTATCFACNVNETCFGVEDDINTTFGGAKVETVGYVERCLEPANTSMALGTMLTLLGLYTIIVLAVTRLRGEKD